MQKRTQHEPPRVLKYNTRYSVPAVLATLVFSFFILGMFAVIGFLEHLADGAVGAVVSSAVVIFLITAFCFIGLLYSTSKGDLSWSREIKKTEEPKSNE
jgi:hypothetical protein